MLLLTDIQSAQLTVSFLDAKGKVTSPAALPVWSSSDPSVATVTVGLNNVPNNPPIIGDPTALNAIVAGAGPGTCQINVTDGVVSATLDVTVSASQDVSAGISAGTPF
jgi:hypothetical protein